MAKDAQDVSAYEAACLADLTALEDIREAELVRVATLARRYYELKDETARALVQLGDGIYEADKHGVFQIAITDACNLADELEARIKETRKGGEGTDWKLHRTRIQQLLGHARQRLDQQAA